MNSYLKILLLAVCLWAGSGSFQQVRAQDPILAVIKAGVTKAIVAMDLQVQRLQNETIWLQNAQKVLENTLSELRLGEIADWTERQRQLYGAYYEELRQVKATIASYQRARDLIRRQGELVNAYHRALGLFRKDPHFTPAELAYMERVYAGILEESIHNLDLAILALGSLATRMSDDERLALLHRAADSIDANYSDLQAFNNQNRRLALQRAKEKNNLQAVQQLYGLPINR